MRSSGHSRRSSRVRTCQCCWVQTYRSSTKAPPSTTTALAHTAKTPSTTCTFAAPLCCCRACLDVQCAGASAGGCGSVQVRDSLALTGGHFETGRYSCTKIVTTVALLQLVDKGLVALDDPVAKHLPAFRRVREVSLDVGRSLNTRSVDGAGVAIKHCLNHTSGRSARQSCPFFLGPATTTAATTTTLARSFCRCLLVFGPFPLSHFLSCSLFLPRLPTALPFSRCCVPCLQ